MLGSISRFRFWIFISVYFLSRVDSPYGYKVGDAVDTVVWYKSSANDATRAQMPLFGVSSQVEFPRYHGRFSLGFEEGLHALPYIDARNLESLVVKFVYSKSGSGQIHAVSSENVYQEGKSSERQIKVEYQWLEEEPVDIQAGMTAMFLATFLVSIIFLLQACGLADDDEGLGNEADGMHGDRDQKWGHDE